MKIQFVRSGGFAGIKLAIDLDTADMSREQATELEALVDQSGFLDLPTTPAIKSRGADQFEYRIRVVFGGRPAHAVVILEQAVPARVQPLLARLTALALQRAPSPPEKGAKPEDPRAP